MLTRREVAIPVGSERLAGWLYPPAGSSAPWPCVLLAHGFGLTRQARLGAYAERFAAAGIGALVFDYRYFGDSTGTPRQLLDVQAQRADWKAALRWVRARSEVDSERVALWGTSFSGGHVLATAARDPRVAAVIAQVPFTDGWRLLRDRKPSAHGSRLVHAALRDTLRGLLRADPVRIKMIGGPGEFAMMSTSDATATIRELCGESGFTNEICARILLRLPLQRPGRRAGSIRCPLLVQVLDADTTTPPEPAAAAAANAPRGQLLTYPGDHLDAYSGELFEKMITDQVGFLAEQLRPG